MSYAVILGVDPGTANTGYSILCGYPEKGASRLTADYGVIKTSINDGSVRERIDLIGNDIYSIIKHSNVTHFAFEDFTEQGEATGTTYKEMAFLIEHLRMIGRFAGIPTVIYENGEWKRKTMGAARVNKQQVQHYVSRMYPETVGLLKNEKDHVWDSVGIGHCLFRDLCLQGE